MPRKTRHKMVGKIERIMQEARADELAVLARTLRREWKVAGMLDVPEPLMVVVEVVIKTHEERRAS